MIGEAEELLYPVRKTAAIFTASFILLGKSRTFYRDRLGTSIGKVEKTRVLLRFLLQAERVASEIGILYPRSSFFWDEQDVKLPRGIMDCKETKKHASHTFAVPFINIMAI